MAETNSILTEKLNDEQRQAVMHDKGPLLIVAGAGTGKTTVLINRLAYLVTEKNVDPENVLLLTFTEKAAGEMVERADKAMPYGYVNLWINTFHSFCESIIRDRGLEIGLNSDFRLITQTEQWVLIKKNLFLFELEYYSPLGNPDKFVSELMRHFSRLKDENISPAEYTAFAESVKLNHEAAINSKKKIRKILIEDDPEAANLEAAKVVELARAYDVYNRLLLERKLMDFGDLILYTLKLFKDRPNILDIYRKQFKYIMVDEFQDTNWSQYELLKMMIGNDGNFVAVGDDDQAIYKFRGASIANIMQFKEDFPKAKQIVLKRNYRSAQIILDKAYNLIKHNNPNRLEEKLGIDKSLIGKEKQEGVVKEMIYASEIDELAGTAEMIKSIHASAKINWSDIAVLSRSNDAAERFAKELSRHDIPSQFVSMKGLYQKSIILDCLAYLKLLDNYHESAALFRVFNLPAFAIKQEELIKLNRYARAKLISLYEAVRRIESIPGMSKDTAEKGRKLNELLGEHYELAAKGLPSRVFLQVVKDCFLGYLNKETDKESADYLNQFYRKIVAYEKVEPHITVKDLLEMIELEQQAGDTGSLKMSWEDADVVRVMTVHASKGLEFDQVFVVNVVDKRFPTTGMGDKIPLPDQLVKEKLPDGDYHLQEERRLFYVAMTRAKSGLYLTRAKDYGGQKGKKGSRFFAEADITDCLEMDTVESNQMERDLAILGKPIAVKQSILLPDKFSFSQLEAFNNCPWQYRFSYILKIPVEEKPVMIFGRLMHNCMREYYSVCLPAAMQENLFGQPQAIDFRWPRLQKIYENHWSDYGYDDREQADKYKNAGIKMLKKIAISAVSEPEPKIMFLEKSFVVKINDYMIRGVIDRMDILPDGTVEIIDYKTGTPKDKLDFALKKQLLLYQVAVSVILNLEVSKLTFYYLENNQEVEFLGTPAELEKVKNKIVETIEEIKKCDFTATPLPLCKYCDFFAICEFRKN